MTKLTDYRLVDNSQPVWQDLTDKTLSWITRCYHNNTFTWIEYLWALQLRSIRILPL